MSQTYLIPRVTTLGEDFLGQRASPGPSFLLLEHHPWLGVQIGVRMKQHHRALSIYDQDIWGGELGPQTPVHSSPTPGQL